MPEPGFCDLTPTGEYGCALLVAYNDCLTSEGDCAVCVTQGLHAYKVWKKPGIRCPLIVNFYGRWDKARLPVPVDCFVCPVSVPTVTFGAARSMMTTEASVAKYMLVDPESTIPVAFFGSA